MKRSFSMVLVFFGMIQIANANETVCKVYHVDLYRGHRLISLPVRFALAKKGYKVDDFQSTANMRTGESCEHKGEGKVCTFNILYNNQIVASATHVKPNRKAINFGKWEDYPKIKSCAEVLAEINGSSPTANE